MYLLRSASQEVLTIFKIIQKKCIGFKPLSRNEIERKSDGRERR